MFPKIGRKTPKMDGEKNGKPYEQMDDLGGFPIIFGLTPICLPYLTDSKTLDELCPANHLVEPKGIIFIGSGVTRLYRRVLLP